MAHLIVTYDLGTTACKVSFFNLRGKLLAQSERIFQTQYPQATWAEQNPQDWWEAVIEGTKECLDKLGKGKAKDIISIGLCSHRESLVLVDASGKEISNCILWLDLRAVKQAEEILNCLGKEEIHQKTGTVFGPIQTAAKISWLKQNQPETIEKTEYFLTPKNYIGYKLTGKPALDYSVASVTGLLDIRNLQWWQEAFELLGVEINRFPKLYFSEEIIGRTTKEVSEVLGIPSGIPVVAGAGDRQCEALGAGILGKRVMESTGTATNVSLAVAELPKVIHPKVSCTIHCLRGYWLIEQGITTTGAVVKWFVENFCPSRKATSRQDVVSCIEKEAKESPVGANKLISLPFFMGARATRWNPFAKGAFFGLTLRHRRSHMARSIMEGIAFEIRACLDILREMGLEPEELILMGGGSRSQIWNQIKANVLGKKVSVPKVTEAASLGAMILAGVAVGAFPDPKEASQRLNKIAKEYLPDLDDYDYYTGLYNLYNRVYQAVEPLFQE